MLLNHSFLKSLVHVDDIEEFEEVSDVSEDSLSILLSEAEDELRFSCSWRIDGFVKTVSYWSEKGAHGENLC